MLEKLVKNKVNKRVLQAFFAHPYRSFTTQELKEMTRSGKASVNRAVKDFLKLEIVKNIKKNRKSLFQINPKYSFYNELADLVKEKNWNKQEDEVTKKLKKIPKLRMAVLTGVFTSQPQMPIDLLLVGEGVSRSRINKLLAELSKMTGLEVNFTVFNRKEYEYRLLMHDRFLKDILDYPHFVSINHIRRK